MIGTVARLRRGVREDDAGKARRVLMQIKRSPGSPGDNPTRSNDMQERRVSESLDNGAGGRGALDIRRAFRLSLRAKGIAAFVALFAYALAVAFVLSEQREALGTIVSDLEQAHQIEERLARVNTSLAHTILGVNEASTSGTRTGMAAIVLDIEAIEAGLQLLQPSLPALDEAIGRLERSMALLQVAPLPSVLLELREGLHELVVDMDEATQQVRRRRAALSDDYRRRYDSITLIAASAGFLGFVLFGGLVTLFFTRLSADLRMLRQRATDVVKGYRGDALPVSRHDEVGALMEAVNGMQHELRERECQLELSRRRQFHEEKMAAFGSLAAAVAHEINNPIAAISGIAEAIDDRCRTHDCPGHAVECQPHLILEHARRISQITRHLSQFTAAGSPHAELTDLNALVQTTCTFLRYDKRVRNVRFELDLDPQLPAVYAVSDHVIQILMNLVLNAADALEACDPEAGRIVIATRAADGGVLMDVRDNGCGMDESTLARAFDEAFTTKPPGKGSGVGLFMCRTLVEEMGGAISLESQPARGTQAVVRLPVTTTS